ncbi:MAG: hypothetical protein KDA25_09340 [Phycisphaerales bacterium]|nr:hypothetical protein [Phycisphaerales bacterium]
MRVVIVLLILLVLSIVGGLFSMNPPTSPMLGLCADIGFMICTIAFLFVLVLAMSRRARSDVARHLDRDGARHDPHA